MSILAVLLCFVFASPRASEVTTNSEYIMQVSFYHFLVMGQPIQAPLYTSNLILISQEVFRMNLNSRSNPNEIFDDQGHIISNHLAKSSSSDLRLLYHSVSSIKNVVIDSSCSFASNFTGDNNAWIKGVTGYSWI